MKRTLYLLIALIVGLSLALPAVGFAKGNQGGGKSYGSERSLDRQDRAMHQYQYRYNYQKQEMPKERYRKQIRTEAPEKDQLRKQVRDPASHLPDDGTEVPDEGTTE